VAARSRTGPKHLGWGRGCGASCRAALASLSAVRTDRSKAKTASHLHKVVSPMALTAVAASPVLKRGLRRVIYWLRAVTPTRPHVVVCGWPQTEGNSVELVRFLGGEGYDVWWLVDNTDAPEVKQMSDLLPGVTPVSRRSARGVLAYLTASVTFFTHGLYLSPPSPRRKHDVNVWHGDGPKRNVAPNGGERVLCDYVVSGSTLFGRAKAQYFGLADEKLLLTGNPRNDALSRAHDPKLLGRLNLRARGFVLYMPTFRAARAHGHIAAWRDNAFTDDPREEVLEYLVAAADQFDLLVAVKPHPLDAASLHVDGARVISDDELASVGMGLYDLLAVSHSLVTDYSSIWTDYLSTGRFVAFAVPDWETYDDSRGVESFFSRDDLPGPVLSSVDDAVRFLAAANADDPQLVARRDRAAHVCGLVTAPGNCSRLVEALVKRGVLSPPRR